MGRKFAFLLLILSISSFKAFSQKVWGYGNFVNICDDREYYYKNVTNVVILGACVDGGIGFQADSANQIYLGANYMFDYGSNPTAQQPIPDLYYKYEISKFRMFFGSFPRINLLNYPRILHNDTLNYYRPNIQGALMELSGDWGSQNVWCDWTGHQTETVHESFMAGTSGSFKLGIFYVENFLYMLHFAGTKLEATHVNDNGGGAVYVGVDFSKKTIFETLKFDIGGVGNYNRVRPILYNHYYGIQERFSLFYKIFGLDATYYKGDKIDLKMGDGFYRSGNYGRLDTYLKVFKNKIVDSKIGWSFHFVDGGYNDNSFQVIFRVNFYNGKEKANI
jgi:hypothetical protein